MSNGNSLQPLNGSDRFASLQALARLAAGSTVKIHAGRGVAGSGVVIAASGEIITNAHVARRSRLEVELPDTSLVQADVVDRDVLRDLALLRTDHSDQSPLALADSDELRVGQLVFAVGNPGGISNALTLGIIHAMPQARSGGPMRMVLADLRLAPGYSGGPMLDVQGRLIGINTMVSGGLGLAVPSNEVKRFLQAASAPQLGITVRGVDVPRSSVGRRWGLLVTLLDEEGLAASAGLRVGDIVLGLDGVAIHSPGELIQAMRSAEDSIVLELVRAGEIVHLAVPLDAAEPVPKRAA